MSPLEAMNAELLLNIVQFGSAKDLGRLAACSKRWFYLVRQYLEVLRGPELVSVGTRAKESASDQLSSEEILRRARDKLQGAPNLLLAFQTHRSTLSEHVYDYVPNDRCVVLGAQASQIQVNHAASAGTSGKLVVECDSMASAMIGRFPDAHMYPFLIDNPRELDPQIAMLKLQVESHVDPDRTNSSGTTDSTVKDGYVKAVIVYACGVFGRYADDAVQNLQKEFPSAAIVGGICDEGYVSLPISTGSTGDSIAELPADRDELSTMSIKSIKLVHQRLHQTDSSASNTVPSLAGMEKADLVDEVWTAIEKYRAETSTASSGKKLGTTKYDLHNVESGVFGVVLAGQAPIRSMVSRGVNGVLTQKQDSCSTTTASHFVIAESRLLHPMDPEYPFRRPGMSPRTMPSLHLVTKIRNTESGETLTARELYQLCRQREMHGSISADFIGFKRPTDNGFELNMARDFTSSIDALVFTTDGTDEQNRTLVDAQVDFFALTGKACMEDMDQTARQLKRQTQDEDILGAVMFSCNGRGPSMHGLIPEEMSDAARFGNVFPDVPCTGFYAGGEIGPLALAGKDNVFQTGRATLQGFTAVFALFIVPIVDRMQFVLDDRPELVEEFVSKKLGTR